MLLHLRTTHNPATDLGWLLHKHPDRAWTTPLAFGNAHVVWPEASAERASCLLLLDVDPIGLVRGRAGSQEGGPLEQYVNDRPYVASSFLSVAIGRVFRSAMAGRCDPRPELTEERLPLEIELPVLPCRGGERLLRELFSPLGYEIELERLPRDEERMEWGHSSLYSVTLRIQARLQDVLRHLYVLIPVLDDDKHYWVGEDEVEKLLRQGEDWLSTHPARETIALRYLKGRRGLARQALSQLVQEEGEVIPDEQAAEQAEVALERPLSLNQQRMDAVVEAVRQSGARRVADLGCGEGKLLKELLKVKELDEIIGIDVSPRALEVAERRLRLDELPERVKDRLRLLQGSALYRDRRIEGIDCISCIEVVEHVEPDRLPAFEQAVFAAARPATVVLTTPNREYNARFEGLPTGRFRHADHRFEWSREEFRAWASGVAEQRGYRVAFSSIGEEDPALGAPTQMAVFSRGE